MKNIFAEAENNYKSNIGSKYSKEDVKKVWNEIATLIENNLLQDKGTQIPDLGTFTLSEWSIHPGQIDVKRPVFRLAERLVQEYGYHDARCYYVTGRVHSTILSLQGIADSLQFDRCTVREVVTEICQALGRMMASEESVQMPLGKLGVLEAANKHVRMRFYKSFLSKIDPKAILVSEIQKEVGCLDADSIISRPSTISSKSSKKLKKTKSEDSYSTNKSTRSSKTSTPVSRKNLRQHDCECPAELEVVAIKNEKEENKMVFPDEFKCYQKDRKAIPKYVCHHRYPTDQPPRHYEGQEECLCHSEQETSKRLILENPECNEYENQEKDHHREKFDIDHHREKSNKDHHREKLDKDHRREKYDQDHNREQSNKDHHKDQLDKDHHIQQSKKEFEEDISQHESKENEVPNIDRFRHPDLCQFCATYSSRIENIKDRNKEEEDDIEKAKRLVFDAESKRKFAEDEMNQMIKDKRRLNRKIECSKLNHKRGEEARRKRLERDNKSDPDPSYIFYRRPDSPVNTNAEYRQQLENQIKKYKDNRRKRYESDMESGVKRLDLCKKELDEFRKQRDEKTRYLRKKYRWELMEQMKRREQIKEMFPEDYACSSDLCGITTKNRNPEDEKKFAENITQFNHEMVKQKQELLANKKAEDLENEKNWVNAIRNESLQEGKCRALQYFTTYQDLKRSWSEAKKKRDQVSACEHAAFNREDGSVFDMKFQPDRCKRCFHKLDGGLEKVDEILG